MAAAIAARNQERNRQQAVENAKNNEHFIKDVLSKHNISQTGRLEYEEVRAWLTKLAETYTRKLPKARANSLTDSLFPGSVEGMKVLSFRPKANNTANPVPDILLEQSSERPPQEGSNPSESADNARSDSTPPAQNEPASRPPSADEVAAPVKSWVVGDDEVDWVISLAMTPEERAGLARMPRDKKASLTLRPIDFEKSLKAWLSYINNKEELQELMSRYNVEHRGRLSREQLVALLTDLNEGQAPDKREVDWVLSQSQGMRASAVGFVSTPSLIKIISLWYTRDVALEEINAPAVAPSSGVMGGCSGVCVVS